MLSMGYVETLMEIYNTGAAFILIFLIGQIIIMMHRVDKDLLKARLFLNDVVLQRTWIYISVSGASFALNTVVKFAVRFTSTGAVLENLYLIELTQLIFLLAFVFAVYNWYRFIASFAGKR